MSRRNGGHISTATSPAYDVTSHSDHLDGDNTTSSERLYQYVVGAVHNATMGVLHDVTTGTYSNDMHLSRFHYKNHVPYAHDTASSLAVEESAHFLAQSSPVSHGNFTNGTNSQEDVEPISVLEIIIVSVVVAFLVITTAGGNLMVIISIRMDKQLQTISNYFLLSLSIADLCIGLFSMPLYTIYLLMSRWPLGAIVCDTWLAMDYTMSNASVANLLVISFDRYFSVTRPLTYRAKRTPRKAAIMISCAWIISIVLWTPWIFAWPYIEGTRTVPDDECYIQFLTTNSYITIITCIAAFYLPVIIMCILYFKIYLETEPVIYSVTGRYLTCMEAGPSRMKRRSSLSYSVSLGGCPQQA